MLGAFYGIVEGAVVCGTVERVKSCRALLLLLLALLVAELRGQVQRHR